MKRLNKPQLAITHDTNGTPSAIVGAMVKNAERFGHLMRPKYRLRPCRCNGGVCADHSGAFTKVLNVLGYGFTQGNDHAKDHAKGNYIIVSRKAFNTLQAIESGVYTELVKERL